MASTATARFPLFNGSDRERRGSTEAGKGIPRLGKPLAKSPQFQEERVFGTHRVQDRLVSTGGRPSDAAPTIRRLVTIRKAVWGDLQRRAARLSASGRSVSPGQLAAIFLEKGLEGLEKIEGNEHRGPR